MIMGSREFCSTALDLSLQICTPSPSNFNFTENGVSNADKITTSNHVASHDPTTIGLNHISMRIPRNFHQIQGRGEFKRNSRLMVINGTDKRSTARAPRMRWNSTLHAHFVQTVQLLGGHQRATPKSILELMNVKDLTLAHVKSHLQMYRTVKAPDKGPAHGPTDTGLRLGNHKGFEDEKGDNISSGFSFFIPSSAPVSSLDSNTFKDTDHQRIPWSSSRNDGAKVIGAIPSNFGGGVVGVMEVHGVEPEDDNLLNLEFTL